MSSKSRVYLNSGNLNFFLKKMGHISPFHFCGVTDNPVLNVCPGFQSQGGTIGPVLLTSLVRQSW